MNSARGTGLAASNFARDPIIREVYHTTRAQKRPGRSAQRFYRARSWSCKLILIPFQGSPIDLATETINGSGRNDENIQYRPGSVNDVEKQPFEIHWALGCSVFDNRAEEVSAARHPGNIIGRPVTENMFFQYGLRYIPPATSGDLYRTVLIERLPHGVSLGQILPRIRGGRIYSASLCNTSSITKHWTALIVFLHETGASAFLRRVAQEGLFIGFTAVSVRRVPTPTYLIHPAMMQGAQYSRTRCLGVCSPEPMFRMAVHRVLANSGLGDQVECFGEHDPSGATSIRFHSIKAAARAFEVLLSSKTPKLIVKYVADPCSL